MGKNRDESPADLSQTIYEQTDLQRDMILKRLKDRGCRITRQRRILLDIILNGECGSCKEIYFKASALDSGIGTATVYRMVNMLEEIGAISRRNMYKVSLDHPSDSPDDCCVIEFDDSSVLEFGKKDWNDIIMKGLISSGYSVDKEIKNVRIKS